MSNVNQVNPDAPPAYTPPSQEFQQQQQEQYKFIQQYHQQQPASPIDLNQNNYGTYPQMVVEPVPVQQVIVVGMCPACRVGVLEDDFTLLGLCCAIVFFPLGILFCLLLREKRCTNCGAKFG